MKFLQFLARQASIAILSLILTAFIIAGCLYFYMMLHLPSVAQLKDVHLQVPLRIYSADGKLMAEYGEKRRVPVKLDQVPPLLVNGFIATEDRRFFEHGGIDPIGIVRAVKELILTGRKSQGASTITMQVARNFFLSPKKTYSRKINEMLLAIKLNQTFSKDQILELYLNKIYLGQRAYGVAAAAHVYYGKKLDQLTLAQMAMIAGLPQAPSRDNPISNPEAAFKRRNHVLERMLDSGYINQQQYQSAISAPITAKYHGAQIQVHAPYVADMVREMLVAQIGSEAAYTAGLKVYTTIDSNLQKAAQAALSNGLISYTERRGWLGSPANFGPPSAANLLLYQKKLAAIPVIKQLLPAVVLSVGDKSAQVLLKNNQTVTIPWAGLDWARPYRDQKYPGPKPDSANQIISPGDLVRVKRADGIWQLAQLPKAEGALISLNPQDGAIDALAGGFSFKQSHFNRVTQAHRQPGSGFKPFIYAAALAKGFTLASIVNDAPIVINDTGDKNDLWRPQNDTMRFYGPTRVRVGLTKSRNLVSIRLLQETGIKFALDYAKNFGFDPKRLPKGLSLALGSADVTPLEMARGYAVFANGGYLINPYIINKITESNGSVIYQAKPPTVCDNFYHCDAQQHNPAPRVIDADIAYLMNSAMQDVIEHGTGRRALTLGRKDLAGKTGTTNDQVDAWFSGFNPHVVTSVWLGFDQPRSLHEYGSQAALPIWINYMKTALADKPESFLPTPPDIMMVRIDDKTGLLAPSGDKDAMFEVFRKGHVPTEYANQQNDSVFDNGGNPESNLF